ncbi:MAG: hypothetical protein Unbinned8454contig1000_41 [Prokaryotic dsDNA virus sp.]|nr:MAG: hypothetical protein Unbinned8454contig1000_41 [Prokaryotic dsDNA virus sp.]|tara:strand:+ start:129 stop:296 length:168 start_codon:yes stop_codon:yes gene_type:complete
MNIKEEQQFLDDYVLVAKTLNDIWCLGDEEKQELRESLIRIAFYVNKLESHSFVN